MTDSVLPSGVYRLSQKYFFAIPGNPWVYAVRDTIRSSFLKLPQLKTISDSHNGINTGKNERFMRYWWESYCLSNTNWKRFVNAGGFRKWYGNYQFIVNFNLPELRELTGSALRAQHRWFQHGITYIKVSSSGFSARYLLPDFVFSSGGNATFAHNDRNLLAILGILNSRLASYFLQLINPTLNYQTGDIERLPVVALDNEQRDSISRLSLKAIHSQKLESSTDETTFDFIIPLCWHNGLETLSLYNNRLSIIESEIEQDIYALYGISQEDRITIEAELASTRLGDIEDSEEESDGEEDSSSPIDSKELAVRWISYAIGVALGRFQPGETGAYGSAIYRLSDFAIGSLPGPDQAEFDELIGDPDTYAYTDPQSGRHVFSTQVEQALRTLAILDGIAVLEEGHPRDLVKLVASALELMLGETQAREVIQTGAGGDLRKFLEKDYFTAWHFKWYRKRPVYWPIQSSKRAYGFVLFHEKITRETFYTIQREPYLDTKRNAVALKIADLQSALGRATGAGRKKIEKDLDELQKLADELAAFAKDLETITLGGYEPEANWIDDGVILRMAPLAKVLPIWKSEPKKYWERLEAGDFDWSHIAMKYWPDRVRQKCKQNKSYAIAHGHEEWYQG